MKNGKDGKDSEDRNNTRRGKEEGRRRR